MSFNVKYQKGSFQNLEAHFLVTIQVTNLYHNPYRKGEQVNLIFGRKRLNTFFYSANRYIPKISSSSANTDFSSGRQAAHRLQAWYLVFWSWYFGAQLQFS